MSGQTARLSHVGPNTYTVSEAVKGGLLVEGFTDGMARLTRAGSTTVLGVALVDAKPWVDPVSPDADGFDLINASPLPTETQADFGRHVVIYDANCAFGKALKAAALGHVTPWVSGTDAADLICGYCDEPGGVVIATKTTGLANISR
jgi:hypothetical protein